MNQEREENTIRELFRQLKRDDEPSAPPFAASLRAALSRDKRADRFRFVRPVAVTIVVLLLAGGAWLIFTKRSANQQPLLDLGHSVTPAPNVESRQAPDPAPSSIPRQTVKSGGQRQKPREPRTSTLPVSEWHSPTVSLLRMPGEQLLKTVPRLDESLIEIRTLVPVQQREQQN